MEITTNIGCRNMCTFCPQEKLIKAYTKRSDLFQMSFDVFKTYVDKIPLDVEIKFSGMSEPCLNPEWRKMLLYAYERGSEVILFSTLVGVNLSDLDLLESIPFKYFWVHLPATEGYEKTKVDEDYLMVLDGLAKLIKGGRIKFRNPDIVKNPFHCRGKDAHPKVKEVLLRNSIEIDYRPLLTRAGNIEVKGISTPKRKQGPLICFIDTVKERWDILLPNGDVLYCCMDYGMQHIIGNLLSSDYDSLYSSEEFLKVQKGQKDESIDVLCRYCELAIEVK